MTEIMDQEKIKAKLEEETLEKEKKKKKEAETYFLFAYTDKLKTLKGNKFNPMTFYSDVLRIKIPAYYELGKKIQSMIMNERAKNNSYMSLNYEDENARELVSHLCDLGFGINDYFTISRAYMIRNYPDAFNGPDKEMKSAVVALMEFDFNLLLKDNNYSILGNAISTGIRLMMKKALNEKDGIKAITYCSYVGNMLNLFDKYSELSNVCTLTEEEFKNAKNISWVGNAIEKGVEAIRTMSYNALDNAEVSIAEKIKMVSKITDLSVLIDVTRHELEMVKEASPILEGRK